jgi:hypothetical protein
MKCLKGTEENLKSKEHKPDKVNVAGSNEFET